MKANHRSLIVAFAVTMAASSAASAQSRSDIYAQAVDAYAVGGPPSPARVCPAEPAPQVVEIRTANPDVDRIHHDAMRRLLIDSVKVPNTTVLLGPDVLIDFSDAADEDIPLSFGPCVTLASDAVFRPDTSVPVSRLDRAATMANAMASDGIARAISAAAGSEAVAQQAAVDGGGVDGEQPARTPHSQGPLLRFGSHRNDDHKVFLEVRSIAGFQANDNVRISGFRLFGPSFGQQDVEDIGIMVNRSLGVEISNMEIAGWGGQGIMILDEGNADGQPSDGPGQEQPNNVEGERMGRNNPTLVFGNYIHHNQHPRTTFDNHTAGYGVCVEHGAWAQIYDNLFDFNRHAIEAAGDSGGYIAEQNLVLKGGGIHYDQVFTVHTHQFDIHGTGDNGFGGQASVNTTYDGNAFQYRADNAISIRGRPMEGVLISNNVFPHEGLENDWGDDAVNIEDRDNLDVIALGPNNVINTDTYGKYGVCDFDGDGVDDLFLATGQSWWFSSYGEFPWSYLGARTERLDQVRLGYFDGDGKCDVLTESDGEWVIASGGTGPWQSIGAFGAPLSEVQFGRFDPSVRDWRPGVTKRTTHAFRRAPNGDWLVTPLSAPDWQPAQSSSFPMNKLRFGDFTGDGVTDVLAVQGGRWSISDGAHGGWTRLNTWLSDDVSKLFIADLDNNGIDDLIKIESTMYSIGNGRMRFTYTWSVSDDGRTRWRRLKSYTFDGALTASNPAPVAYAGRFGAAPGGGVLLTNLSRIGMFYSEAERAVGASPDWNSLFAY